MPQQIEIGWRGGLRINLSLGDEVSYKLFVNGSYESQEIELLSSVLAEGMHFVDVGANMGLYTLFAAKHVGPAGHVSAFEPSPREFARLQDHLELNQVTNIKTYRVGLHERNGEMQLTIGDWRSTGHNTLGRFSHPGVRELERETIRVRALDSLVRDERMPPIDVMKVDVEGAELSVLKGARNALRTHGPVLLLELFDPLLRRQGASRKRVIEFLTRLGYSLLGQPSRRSDPATVTGLSGYNYVAVPRERLGEAAFQSLARVG